MKSELEQEKRFVELVEGNRPRLLKVCRVYAWNDSDREDLYQEMLVQLWRALPNLREDRYASTWLYRVALNTAISFVRKSQSARNHMVTTEGSELEQIPLPPSSDPGNEEQLSQLFAAIAQLNPIEKAVITLFLEEMSYEQIAGVVGVSESNVGVILHRAKKKLSSLMKEVA